jgi:hypothetical protein
MLGTFRKSARVRLPLLSCKSSPIDFRHDILDCGIATSDQIGASKGTRRARVWQKLAFSNHHELIVYRANPNIVWQIADHVFDSRNR